MRTQLASFGHARSATVKTWGASEQGNFAYEWGQAEAKFDGGKTLVDLDIRGLITEEFHSAGTRKTERASLGHQRHVLCPLF
jgi:hypothetical protein